MKAKINFLGSTYNCVLIRRQYANDRVAIVLHEDGGPFGTLTVNLPDEQLDDDCMFVKTWSENEWAEQLLEQFPEVFEDTGRRVQTGHCQASVWKIKNMEAIHED